MASNFLTVAEENQRYIRNLKRDTPCADCGKSYPHYVMEFDHVPEKGEKLCGVTDVLQSTKALKREVAKCDIVCANCHKKRTHRRANA